MPPALSRFLALLSLVACLLLPLLYFWGHITSRVYENLLAAATLAWFVFATIAVTRRRPEP